MYIETTQLFYFVRTDCKYIYLEHQNACKGNSLYISIVYTMKYICDIIWNEPTNKWKIKIHFFC